MNASQFEVKVVDLVDRVVSGSRVEDGNVECKSDGPANHAKAARQLAGLANASGSDFVIWIIGLDEDDHTVFDRSPAEPAD